MFHFTGHRDTDELVALRMDDRDLFNLCQTSKIYFCENQNFWKRRFYSKFGPYKLENGDWRKFYLTIVIYNDKYPNYFDAIEKSYHNQDYDAMRFYLKTKYIPEGTGYIYKGRPVSKKLRPNHDRNDKWDIYYTDGDVWYPMGSKTWNQIKYENDNAVKFDESDEGRVLRWKYFVFHKSNISIEDLVPIE